MKADKSHPTYEIQETPESLIITHRGRQNWGWALINFLPVALIIACSLVLLSLELTQAYLTESEGDPLTFLCLGLTIIIPAYGVYVSLTWTLDQLLDREKITITTASLTIEKSGFGTIHLSHMFPLNRSLFLHLMILDLRGRIVLSPSRFIARLSQMGFFRTWFLTSPMRWFCRGLSKQEHLAILTRIKEKFPNINVLMDDGPLVGPG
jgi:hypothetical protein